MKPEELQIGDWVKCRERDCGGHRVDYISEMDDEVGVDGEILNLNMIFPIPFTPEILEKNGFEGSPTGDLYIDKNLWDKYAIELFPSEGLWLLRITDKTNRYSTGCNKINVYIKYLHELQHALRICGISKEIIL